MSKEKKKFKIKDGFVKVMNSDKQRLTTYLAYIGIVGLSFFSSCLSVIFGLEEFDSARFITNLCFNVAIAILGMILAWKDGELSNETRKTGELYETRSLFDRIVEIVVDTDAFRQWADILYEVKRQAHIMNLLSRIGIYDYEYLLIYEDDLKELQKTPKENIVYRIKGEEHTISLDQITEVQYHKLVYLRTKKIKYEKLPFTFFLSRAAVDEYEKYAKESEHNRREKILALTYRVGSLVALSAIIALSVINPTESSAQQVLFDTIGRIFQLCVSLFMGYTIAHDEARREIGCLKYKCQIIKNYDNDCQTGVFVPKNRTELIREKIELLRNKKIEENNLQEVLNVNVSAVVADAIEEVEEPANVEEVEEVETVMNNDSNVEIITMTEEEYNKYIKNGAKGETINGTNGTTREEENISSDSMDEGPSSSDILG